MSCAEAGAKLGITRNAVIGLAHHNGIKFARKARLHRAIAARRPKFKPLPKPRPRLEHIPQKPVVLLPPRLGCSWHGCARDSEPGDMFCRGHGRVPLLG